jgi:hypothetical protein
MEYSCADLCAIVGVQRVLCSPGHGGYRLTADCWTLAEANDATVLRPKDWRSEYSGLRLWHRRGDGCPLFLSWALCEAVRTLGVEVATDGSVELVTVPRFFDVVLYEYDNAQSIHARAPWKALLCDALDPLPNGELRTPLSAHVRSGALDMARLPAHDAGAQDEEDDRADGVDVATRSLRPEERCDVHPVVCYCGN